MGEQPLPRRPSTSVPKNAASSTPSSVPFGMLEAATVSQARPGALGLRQHPAYIPGARGRQVGTLFFG